MRAKNAETTIAAMRHTNSILKHALRNQWRNYKYAEEYIRLLLGQYTIKEFMLIARKYAVPFNNYSVEDLENACFVIYDALQGNVQTEELAQLLNVHPFDIDRIFIDYIDSRHDFNK